VEDEFMIAMLLEDYLSDMGHRVASHADTIDGALRLIETRDDIDAAILDMNLHGETIEPVALALTARRIPFCFITGYGFASAADHSDAPVIAKPFDFGAVERAVTSLMSRTSPARTHGHSAEDR